MIKKSILGAVMSAAILVPVVAGAGEMQMYDVKLKGTSDDGAITVEIDAVAVRSQNGSGHRTILVKESEPALVTGATKAFFCENDGDNGSLKVFTTDNRAAKAGGGTWGFVGRPARVQCQIGDNVVELKCSGPCG